MSFFTDGLGYARQAHQATGVLTSVILAQWANETAFGGPDWSVYHNPGNVGDPSAGGQTTYPSLEIGTDAYIQTMNLGYYVHVRQALGWKEQATELGLSPWAASHYGSPPGIDLISIIEQYGLTVYDGPQPAPKPPPLKELDEMDSVVTPNGDIVSHAVGTNGHYYEIRRQAGFQGLPATAGVSIIDMTAQYPWFTVAP